MNMMTVKHRAATVFIVNGLPRAGKDTLVDMACDALIKNGEEAYAFSSIDPIREILRKGEIDISRKTPADRKLMATIGDALEEYSGFRSRGCIDFVQAYQRTFYTAPGEDPRRLTVFLFIREPDIIAKVKEALEDGDATVWKVFVESNRAEAPTNRTDAGIGTAADYDYLVRNNGTLQELRQEALSLISLARKRKALPADFGRPVSLVAAGRI